MPCHVRHALFFADVEIFSKYIFEFSHQWECITIQMFLKNLTVLITLEWSSENTWPHMNAHNCFNRKQVLRVKNTAKPKNLFPVVSYFLTVLFFSNDIDKIGWYDLLKLVKPMRKAHGDTKLVMLSTLGLGGDEYVTSDCRRSHRLPCLQIPRTFKHTKCNIHSFVFR